MGPLATCIHSFVLLYFCLAGYCDPLVHMTPVRGSRERFSTRLLSEQYVSCFKNKYKQRRKVISYTDIIITNQGIYRTILLQIADCRLAGPSADCRLQALLRSADCRLSIDCCLLSCLYTLNIHTHTGAHAHVRAVCCGVS